MSKRNGFTLIELLVVIAIIAILLSILAPSLKKVKKQAKHVVCQSNLSQWGKLFSVYLTDNDSTFMDGWFGVANDRDGQWMYALREYTGFSHDIWLCPEAANEALTPIDADGNPRAGVVMTSRSPWGHLADAQHGGYLTEAEDYGSYGINSFVYNVPRDAGGVSKDSYWAKTSTIKKSLSSIPVFMDDMWCESWPRETETPPQVEGVWGGYGMHSVAIDRHTNGYINMLFMDSSVRKVDLKELWQLNWHRDWQRPAINPNWPDWIKKYR